MKKGIMVESVLLRINGGHIPVDASVQRRDIRAYLPAAVNYVMSAGYNINIQVEENRDLSSLFYGYFPNNAVHIDTDRHNWLYINYPKGTVALPKNQGIRSVEDGCGYFLKPLSDNAFRTINHYKQVLNGDKYFRPDGKKIYLFNMPPVIVDGPGIPMSMIVDSAELTDDDELPIPAGLEGKAIDECVAYFTGERQAPANRKSDNRDIN
jgi:hypothetical protein